jgi:AcrR family transcriptional regulator
MEPQERRAVPRRRERQRDETRRDLAFSAFELASTRGLVNVRVPEIAAAAGVSPRTFNNYFRSKEAAVVWPAAQRWRRLADNLLAEPDETDIATAIIDAVVGAYRMRDGQGFPPQWATAFRALVAREPALRGEYLQAADSGEQELARAIGVRVGASEDELWPTVLAATVVAAERAAVRHWLEHGRRGPLANVVAAALEQTLGGAIVDR